MEIFKGKDILVTGGCGSIGSEIVRQLITFQPARVRVLDNSESGQWYLSQNLNSPLIRNFVGDVRDPARVLKAMEGVDIVFHAAALKHVPLCEYNPFEAVKTNVLGTQNVIEAAIDRGVKRFIGISTDKSVSPITTMGATKLLGERLIVNAPTGFSDILVSCVRFGNVLGSVGSVIPIFKAQIEKGGPVTVTTAEMTRFFMTIPQAVRLVLQAATQMKGHEIFILKMDAVRIVDLAEVMIEELAPKYGFRPSQIPIEFIGKRAGEKTHESLFTYEEAENITITEDMFILRNSPFDPYMTENHDIDEVMKQNQGNLLSKEHLRKVLLDNQLL